MKEHLKTILISGIICNLKKLQNFDSPQYFPKKLTNKTGSWGFFIHNFDTILRIRISVLTGKAENMDHADHFRGDVSLMRFSTTTR